MKIIHLALLGVVACSRPTTPSAVSILTYRGFATPESVLYDAENDRYLVSNVNGTPLASDNNGFISVLSPTGELTHLKWIEGGKNGVTLNAPTGSAIAKGILYVADITTIRMFDLASGAPRGEIPIPGVTLLNDVAAAPDGKIYVTDSGFTFGAKGDLQPSGTDAIYVIADGQAKPLVKTTDLRLPNGIAWSNRGLLVCTSGGAEVFRVDDSGAKTGVTATAPGGRLDGIIANGDTIFVSSHEASAVLRGSLGGSFVVAIPNQKSPGDIGYDSRRGRLLVPHVLGDTVDVFVIR